MDITATVDALKKKIAKDTEDALRQRKDTLGLDAFAAAAEQRVRELAARATEISTVLKKCTIPMNDELTIVAVRPGLQIWFDRVHECERDLRGQTFDVQSRLQTALERFKRLTLDDFALPIPPALPIHTALGTFPIEMWWLRETLANLHPLCDVDRAITRLRDAFRELSERL